VKKRCREFGRWEVALVLGLKMGVGCVGKCFKVLKVWKNSEKGVELRLNKCLKVFQSVKIFKNFDGK